MQFVSLFIPNLRFWFFNIIHKNRVLLLYRFVNVSRTNNSIKSIHQIHVWFIVIFISLRADSRAIMMWLFDLPNAHFVKSLGVVNNQITRIYKQHINMAAKTNQRN